MKLLLLLLAIVSLTACGTAAAQTDPGDQYLIDIQAEATRTHELNDRTEALLDGNEVLQATAIAAYAGLGADATGLKALSAEMQAIIASYAPTPQPQPPTPTPVVIVQPFDLNSLTESEMRQVACVLLTIEYVDAFPGFGPATAADIRTNLGC